MFVDQMPTKKVDITEEISVEVQYLSKGYKDEERAILAGINIDVKSEKGDDREKTYNKIKETDYKRVVAGLRSWSSDRPINIENVKLLKPEIFDKILKAVDDYNMLNEEEVKN